MIYNFLMDNPELLEKKFSILEEISHAIVVTDNIDAVANLMLDLAINYTNAEKGSLMLINECGELFIRAARGIDIQLVNVYKEKIGEGIAGVVARSRRPLLVQDIDSDKRFRLKRRNHYRTKSFISCPVICKNRLLGVFNINDKKTGEPFTDDEFALLKIIANQAAITLENAFLMTQLRSKAAELEEINKKLIESDASKTEFLTRISHELRTPLNSIKGAIYYLGQNRHVGREKMQEFFDIISHETDDLGNSVENLLNFLRLEDETRIMKKSVMDLPALINNEVLNSRLLETFLMRRNLQVTVTVQKDISHIVGDKVRVIQLFINLIKGLGSYLEPGDRMELNVYEKDFVHVDLVLPRRLPESFMTDSAHSLQVFQEEHAEDKSRVYLARRIAEVHRWKLDSPVTDGGSMISLTIPKGIRQKIEAVADATMEMFMELISVLMNLKACSIMLTDELIDELFIKCARGLDDAIIRGTRIKLGDSISGWVAFEGKPLLIEDIENDPRFERKNIPHYNTRSLLSLPLKVNGRVIGVINLNNKKSQQGFTKQDLYIAEAFNERMSYFIGKLYSGEFSGDELNEFITSFDSLLDAGRKYHKKDGFLPDLIGSMMNKLRAGEEDVRRALYVSAIYDLGVVLINEITEKKGDLSPSEICSLKAHPHTTVGLLNHFEFSEDVKKAIIHHHERFDGTGYPDRLKGEEIPFVSRVLSVADAFCAMTRSGRYKKTYSKEEAFREIQQGSGSLYDPEIVDALQGVLEEIALLPVWDSAAECSPGRAKHEGSSRETR
jgi:GAF domain-containing protein